MNNENKFSKKQETEHTTNNNTKCLTAILTITKCKAP